MRLIHRSRHQRQRKAPLISISQAEITADLHYPAGRQAAARGDSPNARREVGR
jgi:hypothetical protein